MVTNEQLYHLNALYWFKDSFGDDKEATRDYLNHVKVLAESLEAEGLVKEIEVYLLILKNGK